MYEELRNINILYVEDDAFIREQTTLLLNTIFNNVYTANNGIEGIEMFNKNQHTIHAIITDINMPKLSGIEMSTEIKKDSKIPIIGVSAYSRDDYGIENLEESFSHYLRKPIRITDLIDCIKEVVA